jgi:ketosteroid isomerase-like protein
MKRVWIFAAVLAAVSVVWVGGARLAAGAIATADSAGSVAEEQAAVKKVLDDQVVAWNRGDVETFITGYWNSNDVEFVSGSGVTRGYAGVLARYKKNYPSQAQMGKLTFSDLEIHVECPTSAYAVGQFHLDMPPDNPTGWFTLNLRKFSDGWKIVVDHTSNTPAAKAN